jgi:hypothetical protein
MMAGILQAIILATCLLVLMFRISDHRVAHERNHVLIAAAALLSFGITLRLLDSLDELDTIHWTSTFASCTLLIFLSAEPITWVRWAKLWHRFFPPKPTRPYTGPERRRQPPAP